MPLDIAPIAARRDVVEADELEQLPTLARSAGRADEPLMELQQLARGRPVGEAEELGEVAEAAMRLARAGGRAADLHLAGARPHQAAGDLHERRLPGAVRPEQADELAGADLDVDAAQRLHRPVGLVQARDRQGGSHPRARIAAGPDGYGRRRPAAPTAAARAFQASGWERGALRSARPAAPPTSARSPRPCPRAAASSSRARAGRGPRGTSTSAPRRGSPPRRPAAGAARAPRRRPRRARRRAAPRAPAARRPRGARAPRRGGPRCSCGCRGCSARPAPRARRRAGGRRRRP